MPRQPPTVWYTDIGGMRISLKQQGVDRFTVIYFLQVKKDLTYSDACTELGICIMHALACDSKIDNRTKAEARNDQG